MTEKTEEQIAKEKAAVEAMRNAKSNMDTALTRISDLERSLTYAADCLSKARAFISANVYLYPTNGQSLSVHSHIDAQLQQIRKTLG